MTLGICRLVTHPQLMLYPSKFSRFTYDINKHIFFNNAINCYFPEHANTILLKLENIVAELGKIDQSILVKY